MVQVREVEELKHLLNIADNAKNRAQPKSLSLNL